MGALSGRDILDLWDLGRNRHPVDRALLVLAAVRPGEGDEAPADWSLGRRNAALAKFYMESFRPRLDLYQDCPRCAQRMEFSLDTRELAREGDSSGPVDVLGDSFRLPTSRDLAALPAFGDPVEGARALASRCQISGKGGDWSVEDLETIGQSLAEADPQAETLLELACPSCRHAWTEVFDILQVVWEEIETRAKGLLQEVHLLASAYGWVEAEVLSLSEARRQDYLGMVAP